MRSAGANEDGDGIISLVRETAEGLGRLVADHIKLARVELVADGKAYARHVGILSVAGVVTVLGYGFVWLAAGLALARLIGAPLAFLVIGGAHLAAGVIGLLVARSKVASVRMMDDTMAEVSRSVSVLKSGVGRSGSGNGTAGPPIR